MDTGWLRYSSLHACQFDYRTFVLLVKRLGVILRMLKKWMKGYGLKWWIKTTIQNGFLEFRLRLVHTIFKKLAGTVIKYPYGK
jgi:hypothetical protein